MQRFLKPIDNAALIVFRIFFGFLLFAETLGAIFTGWVKRNFIDPEFTFSHIGLEWLQPLPGNGMYFYFVLMSLLGLMVMMGYKYRLSLGAFTILWAGVYFIQKESYNNHYYLLLLVCIIMWLLPANRFASMDAKFHPEIKSAMMPRWCANVMVLQISIVYFFAAFSKFYPAWLDGTYIHLLLTGDDHREIFVKGLFDQHWFHLFLSWSGIAFDLLIIPLLMWQKSRTIALVAALFFHLFNAIVLQIGIFPFFALSFVLFFYPPEKIRKVFLRGRTVSETYYPENPPKVLVCFFMLFFAVQLLLPIRHYFIKGDVLWTEEGHRLSWRMMLRQKSGYINFKVVDKKTNSVTYYNFQEKLTPKQQGFIATKPDGIWQMCQRIKQEYAQKGQSVAIYVHAMVAVNNAPLRLFVNPETDMATAEWNYFGHSDWIMLYDE